MRTHRLLASLLFAALAACSSGGGGDLRNKLGRDMAMGPPPPDLAMKPYPAGPYGNMADDTIPNLMMEGFRLSPKETNSANLTWDANISVGEYHNNPICKCLLITFGARWCGACKQEQPALIRDVDSDPSFCVLNILQEGLGNSLATRADVDIWTQTYKQNFYVTQGTTQTRELFRGYGMTVGLPFNLIVKTETMKVMDATLLGSPTSAIQGYDPMIHEHAMTLCNGG